MHAYALEQSSVPQPSPSHSISSSHRVTGPFRFVFPSCPMMPSCSDRLKEAAEDEPTLQYSHRFFTELCTFMPRICWCWCVASPVAAVAAEEQHNAGTAAVGLAATPGVKAACERARTDCCCCCCRRALISIRRVTGTGAFETTERDSARKADERRVEVLDVEAAIFRLPFFLPFSSFASIPSLLCLPLSLLTHLADRIRWTSLCFRCARRGAVVEDGRDLTVRFVESGGAWADSGRYQVTSTIRSRTELGVVRREKFRPFPGGEWATGGT